MPETSGTNYWLETTADLPGLSSALGLNWNLPANFYEVLIQEAPNDQIRDWFSTLKKYISTGGIELERILRALDLQEKWAQARDGAAELEVIHDQRRLTRAVQLASVVRPAR